MNLADQLIANQILAIPNRAGVTKIRMPKLRMALVGGSLAAYHTNTTGTGAASGVGTYDEDSRGIFNYANMAMGNPFQLVKNAGVAGQTSAQVLATLASDLAGVDCGYCLVFAGGNDIIGGVPLTTIISNLSAIYDYLIGQGITPIATTISPAGGTVPSTAVKTQQRLNKWIMEEATRTFGIKCFDAYRYSVNPTAGTDTWRTGYSQDGIHPVSVGSQALGFALASFLQVELDLAPRYSTISSLVDTWTSGGNSSGGDGINLYDGVSLMQGTSGILTNITGTNPSTNSGSVAGTSASDRVTVFTDSIGVAGMACVGSIVADASGYGNYQNVAATISASGQYVAFVLSNVNTKGTSGKWYESEAVIDTLVGTTRPSEISIITSLAADQSSRASQGWETVAASAAFGTDFSGVRMRSPRKQYNGEAVLQTIVRMRFRSTGTCNLRIRQVALREYSARFD